MGTLKTIRALGDSFAQIYLPQIVQIVRAWMAQNPAFIRCLEQAQGGRIKLYKVGPKSGAFLLYAPLAFRISCAARAIWRGCSDSFRRPCSNTVQRHEQNNNMPYFDSPTDRLQSPVRNKKDGRRNVTPHRCLWCVSTRIITQLSESRGDLHETLCLVSILQ